MAAIEHSEGPRPTPMPSKRYIHLRKDRGVLSQPHRKVHSVRINQTHLRWSRCPRTNSIDELCSFKFFMPCQYSGEAPSEFITRVIRRLYRHVPNLKECCARSFEQLDILTRYKRMKSSTKIIATRYNGEPVYQRRFKKSRANEDRGISLPSDRSGRDNRRPGLFPNRRRIVRLKSFPVANCHLSRA